MMLQLTLGDFRGIGFKSDMPIGVECRHLTWPLGATSALYRRQSAGRPGGDNTGASFRYHVGDSEVTFGDIGM